MKQWFPRFAEIEAPISVHVIWVRTVIQQNTRTAAGGSMLIAYTEQAQSER